MAARQRRTRRLRGGRDSAGRKDGGGCEAEGPEWGPWGGGKKPQSDMANNDDGATRGGWGEWQDLQAMHDLRAPDRNNAP